MSCILSRGQAPTADSAPVMGRVADRDIKNTSYTGFPRTELALPDDDYAGYRERATTRCTDDGVKPMTDAELEEERKLSWELLKKFTQSIFSMDFTRFSFPVGYSEQRSFLERTADLFAFIADDYAQQMVDCGVPETRLQLLATGIIAGFHIYLASKKPWNPVLGETYVGRWPNGVTMYGEQTSHHPPISDFQIFGPNNEWKCHAHCNFSISSGMLQVDVIQKGMFHLEFDDGTTYQWQFPTISVTGVVKGERYVRVKGPLVVEDTYNDLKLEVEIAPKADKKKAEAKPEPVKREVVTKVVDTRTVDVNLDRFNEKFDELASTKNVENRRKPQPAGNKQKFANNRNKKGQNFQKRRETEAERLQRIQLEKARKAQLKVQIPEEITVGELATRLKQTAANVIKKLMGLGVMASVSEVVDFDTASLIAEEFGAKVDTELHVSIAERPPLWLLWVTLTMARPASWTPSARAM